MAPPKIKKEVSDSTHLRRFVTEIVKDYEARFAEDNDGETLSSETRSAMVDNVLDMLQEPVSLLFENAVSNEFDLYASSDDDDDDDDDGDGDEEEEEEEEEEEDDRILDAEFDDAA